MRQLLKGEVLTDGKPSQILYRLPMLNGGSCNDKVIHSVFLDQIPAHSRGVIGVTTDLEFQQLTELADFVIEYSGTSSRFSASVVSNPRAEGQCSKSCGDLAQLMCLH